MTDKEIVQDILIKVSEYFAIKQEDLISDDRAQKLIFPRFIAIGLIFDFTGLLPKEVMEAIGGKHRSSFYNAIKSLKKIRATPEIKNAYTYLKLLCDPDKPEVPKNHNKTFYNWKRASYKWEIENVHKPVSSYEGYEFKNPLLDKNIDTLQAVKNQL